MTCLYLLAAISFPFYREEENLPTPNTPTYTFLEEGGVRRLRQGVAKRWPAMIPMEI